MRRGTTPTHIFKTKVDLTQASEIFITYKQNSEIKVEKTIEDITIEVDEEQLTTLTTTLTQAETLTFSTLGSVEIQVRVKFTDGKALASNIIKRPAGAILKEGII